MEPASGGKRFDVAHRPERSVEGLWVPAWEEGAATDLAGRHGKAGRAARPEVYIIVRSDSGFCREELMAWSEAHEVDYVLGLEKNERFKAEIDPELEQAAAESARTGKAAHGFKEFVYQTRDSWTRA